MRYTIPKDQKIVKKESDQILHSFIGSMVDKVNAALDFIKMCSGENYIYRQVDYDALYNIYRSLGMSNKQGKDNIFPQQDKKAFKKELEKLWHILEIHTLDKEATLLDIRKKYEADPKKYQDMIEKQEADEVANPQAEEPEEDIKLLDDKSPQFEYVKGTLYEDLLNSWNAFKNQVDTERYAPAEFLKKDMMKLLSQMEAHYTRRNSMGSYVPMSKDEYQNIHRLYQECVRDMKRLPGNAGQIEYARLNKLLKHNEIQLSGLSLDELPPLASVLDGELIKNIKLEDIENKTVGNQLSSREAIEYTDEDGIKHKGFFTADTTVPERKDSIRVVYGKYIEKYPEYEQFFKYLLNSEGGTVAHDQIVRAADEVRKKTNPNALKTYYENKLDRLEFDDDPDRREAFYDFANALYLNINAQNVFGSSGINVGDHIAERAGAMTDVAKALGFSELLAGSKRVTIERNGKKVSGVFMDAAELDSVDLEYLTKEHPFLKADLNEFDSKEMLSSLADLQIIDYLCANTDRHSGNFFIKQDASDPDNPKLTGVVGIDNDNSFGDILEGGKMRLATAKELKIITPKMADAITSMTNEKLQDIMDQYQLEEKQKKSALVRLNKLKGMIENGRKSQDLNIENGEIVNKLGYIHIVGDNEWDQITLDNLVPKTVISQKAGKKKTAQNIFNMAVSRRDKIAVYNKIFNNPETKDAIKPTDPILYKTHNVTMNYETISIEQQGELEQLREIKNGLIEHGGNESSRSKKFKTMYAELDNLISEYTRLRGLMNLDDVELRSGKRDKQISDQYKELNKKREKLHRSIDRYLDKMHFRATPSERNQKRIDLATKLSDLVKESPVSNKRFESEKVLRVQYEAKMGEKNAYQLSSYVTNQIYSMMQDTLRDNVAALEINDKKRALGIKAIKAQERLWRYGQNDGTDQEKKDDKVRENREKTSIENLEADAKKEAEANPTIDQICKDLDAIKQYEPNLSEKIEGMMIDKEKITPRKVKEVLQDLLILGSEKSARNKVKAKQNVKTEKNAKAKPTKPKQTKSK